MKELSEESQFSISIKSLIGIAVAISTVVGMWFALQADIEEAKELPKSDVTRMEFEMKDELVRQTIMTTQEDVQDIKEDLKLIKEKLYE
jgi:hypothetical protein